MDDYHKEQLLEVHRILKDFLAQERRAYQKYSGSARYDKEARRARGTSHRILACLVPRYRMLDKYLNQPGGQVHHQRAAELLTLTLIHCFIVNTRVPDTHPVWQLPLRDSHLRSLVYLSAPLWQGWLARIDKDFPGIAETVCNSSTATLRGFRTIYLDVQSMHQQSQRHELQEILARVKPLLSDNDYAVLVSNLKV